MCETFSGIVQRDRLFVRVGINNHTTLLKAMGIKDNSSTPDFVRVEYKPKNKNYWHRGLSCTQKPSVYASPIDTWDFVVDQDYRPNWFVEAEWREKFKNWILENAIIEDTDCVVDNATIIMPGVTVKELHATVAVNLGTVSENCSGGTVSENYGTVSENCGTVSENCSGGTVSANCGTVSENCGTVKTVGKEE